MRRSLPLSRGASAAGALCFGCFTSAVSLRARCFTPGRRKNSVIGNYKFQIFAVYFPTTWSLTSWSRKCIMCWRFCWAIARKNSRFQCFNPAYPGGNVHACGYDCINLKTSHPRNQAPAARQTRPLTYAQVRPPFIIQDRGCCEPLQPIAHVRRGVTTWFNATTPPDMDIQQS